MTQEPQPVTERAAGADDETAEMPGMERMFLLALNSFILLLMPLGLLLTGHMIAAAAFGVPLLLNARVAFLPEAASGRKVTALYLLAASGNIILLFVGAAGVSLEEDRSSRTIGALMIMAACLGLWQALQWVRRDRKGDMERTFLRALNCFLLLMPFALLLMGEVAGAAIMSVPLGLNALVAFLPKDLSGYKVSLLHLLATAGNVIILFLGAVGVCLGDDASGRLIGALMITVACLGLWPAIQYARRVRKARPPVSKFKKRLAVALVAVTVVVFFALDSAEDPCPCYQSRYADKASDAEKEALRATYAGLQKASEQIATALGEGAKPEELGNLDFGGSAGDLKGKSAAARVIAPAVSGDNFVPQKTIDVLTGKEGTRVIFNWRRQTSKVGEKQVDALFAIIPGVKFCDGTVGYKANRGFKIAKNNHTIVNDPGDFGWPQQEHEGTCVRTPGGKDYYFQILYASAPGK